MTETTAKAPVADNPSAQVLRTAPLTITDFVRYAGAAGDFNPVHHDTEYARKKGFDGPFAMGMFTVAVASRVLTEHFGLRELRSYKVRFVKMVWPGESLVVDLNTGVGDCTLTVANGDGEIKVRASATAGPVAEPESTASSGQFIREFRVPIERGKIAEFALAMQDASPIYRNVELARKEGFDDVPAPPLFLNTSQLHIGEDWYIGRHVGIPIERCVHGENSWTFLRVPVAGETLRGVTHMVKDVPASSDGKPSMRRVTFETKFTDVAGHLVQIEQMVVVELPEKKDDKSKGKA